MVEVRAMYAWKTENHKFFLIKKMINLKSKEATLMSNHLNAFQGLFNQLSSKGIKFDNEIQGLLLLSTLPNSWETFRAVLTNYALNGVVFMELVKGSVLNEEMRKRSQGLSTQSKVLFIEKMGRNKHKGKNGKIKAKASPDLDAIMLSVIIVVRRAISRSIITNGEERIRLVMRNKIRKIMTTIIVLML